MSRRNNLCKFLRRWLFAMFRNKPNHDDSIISLLTRPTNEPPTTTIFRRVLATIFVSWMILKKRKKKNPSIAPGSSRFIYPGIIYRHLPSYLINSEINYSFKKSPSVRRSLHPASSPTKADVATKSAGESRGGASWTDETCRWINFGELNQKEDVTWRAWYE